MASSIKPLVRSYVANGTITPYSFVKFDTSANNTTGKNPGVVACASGQADGIAQNNANVASGSFVEVAFAGGGALLTLGGTVTVSNSIKPTTAGAGIATTTAGDHIAAVAQESGVSGDVIGVLVVRGEKYNADAT